MKSILITAIFIGLLSAVSSLTVGQTTRLLELHSMFDLLHKNYDNQISQSWMRQKLNMDIYNAQFLSRYGFVVQQAKDREMELLAAVDARGQEIGNPNAECLEAIRYSLNNAIDYAGLNFKAINNETITHFNRLSGSFYYPLVETLQFQSNTLQWQIINSLGSFNPATQMTQLISRLEEDYYITVLLYEMAVENLANEQRLFTNQMNQVKAAIFPTYNNVMAYYMYTTDSLMTMVPGCTA